MTAFKIILTNSERLILRLLHVLVVLNLVKEGELVFDNKGCGTALIALQGKTAFILMAL